MNRKPNHYEILGVSQNATYEEIKESFHRLARAKHPDKQQFLEQSTEGKESWTEIDSSAVVEEFRKIQKAWSVLRDDAERKAYDSDLLLSVLKEENRQNGAIAISYRDDLEEAIDEETNETFMVYDCRCGEEICIEVLDAENDSAVGRNGKSLNGILVDCPGCCFVYRIVGR